MHSRIMVEIVSADSGAKIDYRILLVILVGVIGFQLYLNALLDESHIENSVTVVSIFSPLSVGIAALVITKRFGKVTF